MPQESSHPSPASPGLSKSLAKRKHRPGLQRVNIACERCRHRKGKCDGKLPECTSCRNAGVPCIVLDRVTYRQQPRGHVEELEVEIERLRLRVRELESQLAGQDGQPRPPQAATPSTDSLMANASPAYQPSISTSSLTAASPAVAQLAQPADIPFASIVESALIQSNQKSASHAAVHDHDRSTGFHTGAYIANMQLPSLQEAQNLEDAYFLHRWPALPVLHRPTFHTQHFLPILSNVIPVNPVSAFLTFLVLALGAIDIRRQNLALPDSHHDYFELAMRNLPALIGDHSTETVQGLILMTVYSVNEQKSPGSWNAAGHALRMAIDLGLHQASLSDGSNDLLVEMRRRIFWSAYALDRNISLCLGRPCAIRDADISAPLPSISSDEDLMNGLTSPATSASRFSNPFDVSTFGHIIKLRQLQSRIVDTFYPAVPAEGQDVVLADHRQSLRNELDDWLAEAPRYTKPTVATFQSQDWFQIAHCHSLLLLYRPSPASPNPDLDALQICADSAISMISAYSALYAKNKITYTWIALQSLFMASVTMLYTLWVGADIRRSTTKVVVQSNLRSCLALLQIMAEHWPLARRYYEIVDRLGSASIQLFEHQGSQEIEAVSANVHFGQINAEYMDWFGTKTAYREPAQDRSGTLQSNSALNQMTGEANLPADGFDFSLVDQADLFSNPEDWFLQGFDMSIPLMTNVFGNNPCLT